MIPRARKCLVMATDARFCWGWAVSNFQPRAPYSTQELIYLLKSLPCACSAQQLQPSSPFRALFYNNKPVFLRPQSRTLL